MPQPALETDRLLLRPFAPADAPAVRRLAGEREIAAMTLTVPHPYPEGAAEEWIAGHAVGFEAGQMVTFAIAERETGALAGAIGLHMKHEHGRAELGYWIGRPYWGRGYATEAGRAIIAYGFETLDLHRIHASHFPHNPASGRVLEKLGMQREGRLREHYRKWGEYTDAVMYGILASEWRSSTHSTRA